MRLRPNLTHSNSTKRSPTSSSASPSVAFKYQHNIVTEQDCTSTAVFLQSVSASNYEVVKRCIEVIKKTRQLSKVTMPSNGWSAALCAVKDVEMLKLLHNSNINLFKCTSEMEDDGIPAGSHVLHAALRYKVKDSVEFLLSIASFEQIAQRDWTGVDCIDIAVCNEHLLKLMEQKLNRQLVSRVGKRIKSSLSTVQHSQSENYNTKTVNGLVKTRQMTQTALQNAFDSPSENKSIKVEDKKLDSVSDHSSIASVSPGSGDDKLKNSKRKLELEEEQGTELIDKRANSKSNATAALTATSSAESSHQHLKPDTLSNVESTLSSNVKSVNQMKKGRGNAKPKHV